jgi:RimJ/RimL family protein N-acetyltransferase
MTQDQREYYRLKNELEIKILSEHNPTQKLYKKLGMTKKGIVHKIEKKDSSNYQFNNSIFT